MRRYTVVFVAVLFVGASLPLAGAVGGETVTTVDANHGLTDRSAIEAYEQTGSANATIATPNMRLTVAEGHDAVGLDGFWIDSTKRYLRVQYNESIERTVRFYIPSEYWHPTLSLDTEAETSDAVADFRPTDDGRYTAVTMTADGKTDAVFTVSTASSGWFWAKDAGRTTLNNSTGYQPPRIGSGGEWAYVPAGQLANESSYPINSTAGATIQFDSTPATDEQTWLSVPECSGDDVPVCTFQKRGVDDETFILSKTSSPPPVRWKAGSDPRAGASSALNDLLAVPDRIQEFADGLFGDSS